MAIPSAGDERGHYSHLPTEAFAFEYDDHDRHRYGRTAVTAIPVRIYRASVKRYGHRRGPLLLGLCCLTIVLSTYALHQRFLSADKTWPIFGRKRTVIYSWEELRSVWEREIQAGYYPSTNPIPEEIGFTVAPVNPALPASVRPEVALDDDGIVQYTIGSGPERVYHEVRTKAPEFGHPPRPIPGSVLDLDKIHEICAFERDKYVRDCLEYLRLGGGLDNSRLRRDELEELRHIYVLDKDDPQSTTSCVEEDPRIFHMFWAGAFTDKPYMAMLSFLFTQNLGLDRDTPASELPFCPPQLWMWVSRGNRDNLPNPNAEQEMFDELRASPWASPFLHPRFKDAIHFRLWNTTEQLDSTDELRNRWRTVKLRSEGRPVPSGDQQTLSSGGKYDKAPVVLSDLVRFVLCHRYGGVYLDVDVVFLRDWEELWGWSGSYSYRWSIRDRYNTAVLRLRRGSALGTFILRTALDNGLDFHPIPFSFYLQDAKLDKLLYRIPDALFDPAWLTTDYLWLPWKTTFYQRDRPPTPPFTRFDDFFDTPQAMGGMPAAVGFDGFFRGAYMYHFHNAWWKPFDKARDWPDLGPRFAEAEGSARGIANRTASYTSGIAKGDQGDLDWSTVLKRTMEGYIRGDRPNMYGEWLRWET